MGDGGAERQRKIKKDRRIEGERKRELRGNILRSDWGVLHMFLFYVDWDQ